MCRALKVKPPCLRLPECLSILCVCFSVAASPIKARQPSGFWEITAGGRPPPANCIVLMLTVQTTPGESARRRGHPRNPVLLGFITSSPTLTLWGVFFSLSGGSCLLLAILNTFVFWNVFECVCASCRLSPAAGEKKEAHAEYPWSGRSVL